MNAKLLFSCAGVAALLLTAGCDTSNSNSTSSVSAPVSASVAPAVQHYENSPANARAPQLAQNYVGFEFDFPTGWSIDPQTGSATAQNFVKVLNRDSTGTDTESFAVGYSSGTGNPAADRASYPALMQQAAQQFGRGIPGFRLVDTGETTVGQYQGYQMRFTGQMDRTGGQPLQIWGRGILIPGPEGQRNGVFLVLLATSASQEVRSLDDVGVRGGMPVILNSFRLAPAAASAAAPSQSAPTSAQAPAEQPQGQEGYEQQSGYEEPSQQEGGEQPQDGGGK